MVTRSVRRAVTVAAGVAAFALVAPAAQAGDVGTQHYSCGQTRPQNLDGSLPFPSATGYADVRRGSSDGCGLYGTTAPGDQLDYYCYTLGNDGYTWTYLSDLAQGIAGWSHDYLLPGNGSSVHCPI